MVSFTLDHLLQFFTSAVTTFPDARTGKNTHYRMLDAALGAFAVFFTQSPSFLAHQQRMQYVHGRNNAHSVFGMATLPSDNQIRNMLDAVTPSCLDGAFRDCFVMLEESGALTQYQVLDGQLLVALDGTWYTSSETIHCNNCQTQQQQDGTTVYYHSMVTPVVVAPGNPTVVPLLPEHITPQDGHGKQDCERQAAKRWLDKAKPIYGNHPLTIIGDDLYSCQSIVAKIKDGGWQYILVCKPDSHQNLTAWVDLLAEGKDRHTVTVKRQQSNHTQTVVYQYANHVPLRESADCLWVNWFSVTITNDDTGRQVYQNSFITGYEITEYTVAELATCGRTRWKVENESNNTLKTKGYHLEHNYGHGQKHLAALLASMTLVALLFHNLFAIGSELYREVRQLVGSRLEFFNHIRALLIYGYHTSWEALLGFMRTELLRGQVRTPG